VALLALGGLALVPQLGAHSVIPQLRDRNLVVDWQSAAGTSLPEMDRLTTDLSKQLRAIPGVKTVVGEVGRAVISDQVADVNSGQLWLTLDPKADYDKTTAAVRQVVANSPARSGTVSTYPDQRLQDVQARTPDTPVTVRLFGQDFATLTDQARQVRDALNGIAGVTDATMQVAPTQAAIEVTVDLAAAARYGLKPGDVRRQSTTLVNGLPAGSLYQNQQIFDVVVVGQPSVHKDLAAVQNMLIDTPAGDQIRLNQVATVQVQPIPTVIEHENASRYLDVTATVHGRDLGAVLTDVRAKVASMTFPTAFHAEVSSALADKQNAEHRTLWQIPALAVVMLLLLQAAFRSWRRAILLMLVVPLALVGGVAVAPLAGGVKTLGALLGLLLVFGLAIRHGIVLVRGYQKLEQADSGMSGVDLVVAATREHAPAIVLSALGTGLLLAPFVALRSLAGGEVLAPLATVALGGLLTSTLLMVYVLPALYSALLLRHRRPTEPPTVPIQVVPDEQPTVVLSDEQPTVAFGIPSKSA
jgi:Cu/Ag efflux pump CusA